ncbi:sushi, von Willebrand factor type A, EGF and pentraxin domain-containing protein 1-like [Corticium candelabrum]|uniref:sushi, von Willebrand factor type A, EGF and pentraxin domain-containing protein 1-like n=1 Tax=Corticium candelabrum TaxID=121492 RepID=UPI002E261CD0|nr:sushi, von Willebrand factor type A, EGF and pentraxin domain-containing protein 1-like [Corticium candelabrum]
MCTNTIGSFTCTCINCYAGDGAACTLVDCGGLSTPPNGVKNSIQTTCDTTVSFSCNAGFSLQESSSRSCQHNGIWSGTQPTCQDIDECNIGSHMCHTNAMCTNTIGSYSCSCHSCYTGNGVSCNLIYCSRLSAPAQGSVSGSQTSCGSTVTFSCSSGYTLSGSTSRACQTNGAWSGSTSSCHLITYNVAGYATDVSSGSRIGGASVSLGSRTTTASSSGSFSFSAVPGATYTLSAAASGYVSNSRSLTVSSNIAAGSAADIGLTRVLSSGK